MFGNWMVSLKFCELVCLFEDGPSKMLGKSLLDAVGHSRVEWF